MSSSTQMPTIDSFKWNSTGWQPAQSMPGDLSWSNEAGDLVVQVFRRQVPPDIPSDWRDVNALRAQLAELMPPKSASVSTDVFSLPAGITGAQYITKEFMPEPSLGHAYSGMITLPFRDFFCNFVFIACERGVTGVREATLMAAGKVKIPAQEHRRQVRNDEEREAAHRQARQRRPSLLGTDDEQWDAAFPDHPVSRIRTYLRHLRATLKVDSSVKDYPPFGS